ncbi:Alpha/Beta hydrolase protein [Collybia nuda]|uniref:Alpha/Beta hydrolase protein n=1 Tax=Collybia nuda TaxID=64659 RepID=A0A9P5Y0H2_9AGAR|nr:Alpha/Beta hydrolase protein [Collybia nuda]
MSTSTFERSTITIPSAHAGWNFDTWCYFPSGSSSGPRPVVIMAHGLSGTKLMGLGPYAEAFATSNYACVIFRLPPLGYFGTAEVCNVDGAPRWIVSVADQLEDYRTVIKWARQQVKIDPHRLVLWGTSFSGRRFVETSPSQVLKVILLRRRALSPARPLSMVLLKTMYCAVVDSIKRLFGLGPMYIPVVAAPSEVGGLTTEGAQEGFNNICRGLTCMNASAIFQIMRYKAINSAANTLCPILIVAPEDDNLCSLWAAADVADKVSKGEILKIHKAGHFDIYPNSSHHGESISSQLQFLQRVVPVQVLVWQSQILMIIERILSVILET